MAHIVTTVTAKHKHACVTFQLLTNWNLTELLTLKIHFGRIGYFYFLRVSVH